MSNLNPRHIDPVLPTDSEERKKVPIFSGVVQYFPLALAAVARLSKRGNDKHNPGQPLHWSRDKSNDHEDCIARHLLDIDTYDPRTGEFEDAVALAWRALAKLQILEEERLGKTMSRASKVTPPEMLKPMSEERARELYGDLADFPLENDPHRKVREEAVRKVESGEYPYTPLTENKVKSKTRSR